MKLGVCVPYRNREAHLKEFVPKVGQYLESQGIDYQMYFGHQVDDKLFNRGAMKNIAAEWAFKEGCDYIVWHDIDMIPEEGCDYSFPEKHPIHIATNISQMHQTYMNFTDQPQDYLSFNGKSSYVEIPCTRSLRRLTNRDHTVSVMVRASQQEDKVPIWLVGDEDRRFCEYPIIRRPGYDWGLSYNNSRAYTAQLWNNQKEHLYSWMKRYENQWSMVTLVVRGNNIHFYMNGKESDARWGTGTHSPMKFEGLLKRYGNQPYYLGTTPSVTDDDPSKWFSGDIGDVKMWNRALTENEIQTLGQETPEEDLQLHYTFEGGIAHDHSGNGNDGVVHECSYNTEILQFPFSAIPHRRPGRLYCLDHEDEGLIDDNGTKKWAKGETTARNERRFVHQMQQGEWDYKSDGINQLKYELVGTEDINDKAKFINVKL